MRQNEKKARKTKDNEEMQEPYTKMIRRKELIKKCKTELNWVYRPMPNVLY